MNAVAREKDSRQALLLVQLRGTCYVFYAANFTFAVANTLPALLCAKRTKTDLL